MDVGAMGASGMGASGMGASGMGASGTGARTLLMTGVCLAVAIVTLEAITAGTGECKTTAAAPDMIGCVGGAAGAKAGT